MPPRGGGDRSGANGPGLRAFASRSGLQGATPGALACPRARAPASPGSAVVVIDRWPAPGCRGSAGDRGRAGGRQRGVVAAASPGPARWCCCCCWWWWWWWPWPCQPHWLGRPGRLGRARGRQRVVPMPVPTTNAFPWPSGERDGAISDTALTRAARETISGLKGGRNSEQ